MFWFCKLKTSSAKRSWIMTPGKQPSPELEETLEEQKREIILENLNEFVYLIQKREAVLCSL